MGCNEINYHWWLLLLQFNETTYVSYLRVLFNIILFSGSTGGVEITTAFQAIRDEQHGFLTGPTGISMDMVDGMTNTSAVTISIGSTTKLHVNEEKEEGPADRFQSLSCLDAFRSDHQLPNPQFHSLTNFKSESNILREGRARTRPPRMGTSRLGTPPLQRFNTPPRSLERNKISTVFLPSSAKSSTPKNKLNNNDADYFDGSFTAVSSKVGEFYVKRSNPFRSDVLHMGGVVPKDQLAGQHMYRSAKTLPRVGSRDPHVVQSRDFRGVPVRSARAGSCSSQESSGVSSCDCHSMVTVNGQHHCTAPASLYSTPSSLYGSCTTTPADLSVGSVSPCEHQSCEDTLSTCSDCDSNLIIVHVQIYSHCFLSSSFHILEQRTTNECTQYAMDLAFCI